MLVKTKSKPILEKTFPVGRLLFYPNILVGEFNEGVHVTRENTVESIQWVKEVYGDDMPFVYISNRRHSYSIDLTSYLGVAKMFPNYKGFAIVSENRYRRMLAKLEKFFVTKPIAVFIHLGAAIEWAEIILNEED